MRPPHRIDWGPLFWAPGGPVEYLSLEDDPEAFDPEVPEPTPDLTPWPTQYNTPEEGYEEDTYTAQRGGGMLPLLMLLQALSGARKPTQLAHHENSITDDRINRYGPGNETGRPVGTPLPPTYLFERDEYPSDDAAVDAARRRSLLSDQPGWRPSLSDLLRSNPQVGR